MDIRIISVGHQMPTWLASGFDEYQKRLPKHQIKLTLCEIPPSQKKTPNEIKKEEAKKILKMLGQKSQPWVILDCKGKNLSSELLANKLATYQDNNVPLDIIIGGAFGLDDDIKINAKESWSFGAITLPHMLVRVILAEQLYRAWAINNNHPYHK